MAFCEFGERYALGYCRFYVFMKDFAYRYTGIWGVAISLNCVCYHEVSKYDPLFVFYLCIRMSETYRRKISLCPFFAKL